VTPAVLPQCRSTQIQRSSTRTRRLLLARSNSSLLALLLRRLLALLGSALLSVLPWLVQIFALASLDLLSFPLLGLFSSLLGHFSPIRVRLGHPSGYLMLQCKRRYFCGGSGGRRHQGSVARYSRFSRFRREYLR